MLELSKKGGHLTVAFSAPGSVRNFLLGVLAGSSSAGDLRFGLRPMFRALRTPP